MRTDRAVLVVGVAAIATIPFQLSVAPPALADCVNAGNATVCAQGTVTGGGPTPPSAGPYTPYPCELDYLCDAGLSIELGPIDPPWRPGGGGGRPGGGGRN
jgi:hypothetical protein